MSKHVLKDGTICTITHTMPDGTKLDSIEGYCIPYNEQSATFYHILDSHILAEMEKDTSG